MAFIGNTPTQQAFTPAVDFFNGNGSTTAFTLSKPVASVAQVQAVISNVPQNPGDAFTVSGNTITFTSAPPSGTSNIYVYYTSPITQVIAPGQGTVGSDQLQSSINITTLSTTNGATVQGLTVGRGAGAVSTNTAVGASALATNSSGDNNTGLGNEAGYSNQTGSNNVAVGSLALRANTASQNVAVGVAAMYANTTGTGNTAIGSAANYASMRYNTTGSYNVAVGAGALAFNTVSNLNTAIGYQAAYSFNRNDIYGRNVAIGYQALYSATTSNENIAIGVQAGYSSSTNGQNVFIGEETGFSTTGGSSTFVGYAAGSSITSGAKNTIIGRYNGNQGGLDIRTASNYVVLSDGDGNPRQWWDGNAVRGSVFNASFTFSDNFNSWIATGFYRADPSATNAPSAGNYWAVTVSGNSNNVVTQLASPLQSSTLYVRSYNAAWSAWVQL